MTNNLKERLDRLATKYNSPEFFTRDPVSFPTRYSDKRDIEISALVTSIIAWGRRDMILRDAERIHAIMEHEPYHFVTEGDIEAIGEGNLHRTFFGRHLRYLLRGLREIYGRYGSLEDLAAAECVQKKEAPAWELAAIINKILDDANAGAHNPLIGPSRCLPSKPETSALKRFNMMLRWLVRNDGKVDLGVWDVLKPSQLYIPLDVHSGRTGRALGLLTRTADDRRAAEELTASLRRLRPDDPTFYDFALFGAAEAGEFKTE